MNVEITAEQTSPSAADVPVATKDEFQQWLVQAVASRIFRADPEFAEYGSVEHTVGKMRLRDFLFAVDDERHEPDKVFRRLRWGGQFVYISESRADLRPMVEAFADRGFEIVRPPSTVRVGRMPLFGKKVRVFVARKVHLIRPREISERFTYHVQLDNRPVEGGKGSQYVVLKEIPSVERVVARLKARFPETADDVLEKRARKFTDKIFPLFLTREAALLKILERDLPPHYAQRVPKAVDLEKDDRGRVKRLWMNWLRNGGEPLTQLEFARESADLLRALHDTVGVIHLDLRLDNFVITPAGVGFVDFGSSVRVGEDISENPLLSTLFEELMRTSEIQRMLKKMTTTGQCTSPIMNECLHKVDKALDLFYLAVQISSPHRNPELKELIHYDPHSAEAKALKHLTDEVLRPANRSCPTYQTASDLLEGLRAIEQSLRYKT